VESLTDTLIARVDQLVETGKGQLLSTTPTSVVVWELVARLEALEEAVREIALEVEKLSPKSF